MSRYEEKSDRVERTAQQTRPTPRAAAWITALVALGLLVHASALMTSSARGPAASDEGEAFRAWVAPQETPAREETPEDEAPVLTPVDAARERAPAEVAPRVGQSKKRKKRKTLRPATLIIVANFAQADATVNGLPYPEYVPPGEKEGMLLPAGGPYTVEVKYGNKSRTYTLSLRPYETRYLMVELSGYTGTSAPVRPGAKRSVPKIKPPSKKKEDGNGRVTVYSKPRGTILIDGKDTGKRTPNTVDSATGRHEVQVRYEGGQISEKKIVRVRKGSRIKLFFRKRDKK